MGSMNKIKNDEASLERWIRANGSSSVLITDKLDGVSALCIRQDEVLSLYTRGNGSVGQDISWMIDGIHGLSDDDVREDFVVRGELIISKSSFKGLLDEGTVKPQSNARNIVAGIVNSKIPNQRILGRIEFVCYESIADEDLTPYEQIQKIGNVYGLRAVFATTRTLKLCTSILVECLKERKRTSPYEIDGMVVYNDTKNERNTVGNPSYAFAFKLPNDAVQVTVTDIQWNISKDKYLYPVVCFEPIYLNGVTINKASGFNAKYISDNRINKGSEICVTRSGDVIPYITNVCVCSAHAGLPTTEEYVWTTSGVDIMLVEDNDVTRRKALQNTIEKLDIKGIGTGTVRRLYGDGIYTLLDLLSLNEERLTGIPGIQTKSARNIVRSIEACKSKMTLEDLMYASNSFGRGIGRKTIRIVLRSFPDILTDTRVTETDLITLSGIDVKTARTFMSNIPTFNTFLDENELRVYVRRNQSGTEGEGDDDVVSVRLKGLVFVFSGFRDKNLEATIIKNGGVVDSRMNSSVTHLVTRGGDKSPRTSKMEFAIKNNIYIVDEEHVMKKLICA
jgi:NAD-dependent DNA ligase